MTRESAKAIVLPIVRTKPPVVFGVRKANEWHFDFKLVPVADRKEARDIAKRTWRLGVFAYQNNPRVKFAVLRNRRFKDLEIGCLVRDLTIQGNARWQIYE